MSEIARARKLLRLSRAKEELENQEEAFARQDAICERWCRLHWAEVTGTYHEGVVSGWAEVKRPVWEQAFADLLAGEYDVLVISKMTRLSRKGAAQVAGVLDALQGTGRGFVCVDDGLDSRIKAQRAVIISMSEFARDQSETTSYLVKGQKERARLQGRWLGGATPFGYKLAEDGGLQFDPAERPVLQRMVDLAFEGQSAAGIARTLNAQGIPSPKAVEKGWRGPTVSLILRNPVLCGWMPINRIDGKKRHRNIEARNPETGEPIVVGPALITPADRKRLLKILDGRTFVTAGGGKRGKKQGSLLAGLIWCHCGSRMNSRGRTYACADNVVGRNVPQNSVMTTAIEKFAGHQARLWLSMLDPDHPSFGLVKEEWLKLNVPEVVEERARLEEHIQNLEAKIDQLRKARWETDEFSTAGGVQQYNAWMADWTAQLKGLQEQKAAVEAPEPDLTFLFDYSAMTDAWDGLDFTQKRNILAMCLERITILPARVRGQRFTGSRVRTRFIDGLEITGDMLDLLTPEPLSAV